jgi:hypothetical protein
VLGEVRRGRPLTEESTDRGRLRGVVVSRRR